MKVNTKRLPDTEFTVMKVIWSQEPPVTSHTIMELLDDEISWKPQTLLTLLARLTEKGFLSSERIGTVSCGLWPLYRYDPRLVEQGKNPALAV